MLFVALFSRRVALMLGQQCCVRLSSLSVCLYGM